MAISHVCLSCGLDLARVRARLEPRYALPIVICPDCGWAAVRRRSERWTSLRRPWISLITLAVQVALLVGALAGLLGISSELGDDLVRGSFGTMSRAELIFRLIACAGFAVALGTWLTVGFGHAGRIWTWLVFSAMGILIVGVGAVVDQRPDCVLVRCLVAALLMTAAIAGIPAGMLARVIWRRVEHTAWQRRRRQLRARSAGL